MTMTRTTSAAAIAASLLAACARLPVGDAPDSALVFAKLAPSIVSIKPASSTQVSYGLALPQRVVSACSTPEEGLCYHSAAHLSVRPLTFAPLARLAVGARVYVLRAQGARSFFVSRAQVVNHSRVRGRFVFETSPALTAESIAVFDEDARLLGVALSDTIAGEAKSYAVIVELFDLPPVKAAPPPPKPPAGHSAAAPAPAHAAPVRPSFCTQRASRSQHQAGATTLPSSQKVVVPVAQAALPYPYEAQRAGREGFVKLRMAVGSDGAVSDVTILESQPKGVFDKTVIDTFKRYRYAPDADTYAVETQVFFCLQDAEPGVSVISSESTQGVAQSAP